MLRDRCRCFQMSFKHRDVKRELLAKVSPFVKDCHSKKKNFFFVHVLPYRVRNVSNAHLKDLHNNQLRARPRPMLQEQSQSDMLAEANREAYNYSRSISPRSVQLLPMGSELGWGLFADQSESRKFLCPNMEHLCAALKSAAKTYMYVQCFTKMYSSVSRLCDNQSLPSHLLGSKNDKEK